MAGDRLFRVGETVVLVVKVSQPGTRTPDDPAEVVLVSLTRGDAPEAVDATAFARVGEGHYRLTIPTEGRPAGTYKYLIRVSDGPEKVVLVEDDFVLVVPGGG